MPHGSLLTAHQSSEFDLKKEELVFKCQVGCVLATTLMQICLAADKLSALPEVVMQLVQYLSVWNWSATATSEQELTTNLERISFQ